VKVIRGLPLGWSLADVDDYEATYLFWAEDSFLGVRRRLRLFLRIAKCGSTMTIEGIPTRLGETRTKMFEVKTRRDLTRVKRYVGNLMRNISRKFYKLTPKRRVQYNVKLPGEKHPKEKVVLLVTENPPNMILALRKFQTYKEYPTDLHLREHIVGLRMLPDRTFHQLWDGQPKRLYYTL